MAAAKLAGAQADPLWERIAQLLYIPVSPDGSHHLPFDPSVPLHSTADFGGGPLPLLFLPSLDLSASPKLISGDYAFAVRPMPLARAASSSMGPASAIVAAATVGDGEEGAALLAGCTVGSLDSRRPPALQLPRLRASPDRITTITVCTRPFRPQGPRLDVEQIGQKTVVHNYGHGGAGISLSWGCAAEITRSVLG